MKIEVQVLDEVHEQWPARNGRPAGQTDYLLVWDASGPGMALRTAYQYRLADEELGYRGGALVGQRLTLAVHEIANGPRGPIFRGRIVGGAPKNPVKA